MEVRLTQTTATATHLFADFEDRSDDYRPADLADLVRWL